ncbi:hypothetical protein QAD02_007574 [Eretmocerus hayati]|uniref:Uncharacterized protein n=1 Tax=Eretmocerus hayati TaxID=131215 RepID=A0ACC2N431_9HYME|nr:hypothetical protein QAD02_007574 [Eretmocerus hayati]
MNLVLENREELRKLHEGVRKRWQKKREPLDLIVKNQSQTRMQHENTFRERMKKIQMNQEKRERNLKKRQEEVLLHQEELKEMKEIQRDQEKENLEKPREEVKSCQKEPEEEENYINVFDLDFLEPMQQQQTMETAALEGSGAGFAPESMDVASSNCNAVAGSDYDEVGVMNTIQTEILTDSGVESAPASV